MCDACEQQPCAIQLKEDVSILLEELDALARDYEGYDYGLPLGMDEVGKPMRTAVYRFLAKYRPDIGVPGGREGVRMKKATAGQEAEYFTPTVNGKVAALKFSTFAGLVLTPAEDLAEATFFKDRQLLQSRLSDLSSRHASDEVGIVPSRIIFGGDAHHPAPAPTDDTREAAREPRYSFTVEWSDGDASFIVLCPEFPGLSAFGDTHEEAVREGMVALGLMIEVVEEGGEPLPGPLKFVYGKAKAERAALSALKAWREAEQELNGIGHTLSNGIHAPTSGEPLGLLEAGERMACSLRALRAAADGLKGGD